MSYLYQGQQVAITLPVHSISMNKCRMAVKHQDGLSYIDFANSADAKGFLNWLGSAN
ncbi:MULTISPECIES: hypothetical protein [Pseudoalteromonas]|uniref:Uncharacterized protein n=2 Tax=Pseudoalteromonas TaxID=53246 RepID=V4JB45_PSEL2|nr:MULTISPECIES: hypothetical protein [Pseudoalteromonas]ESP92342.1 hypothetical protein PL2TA16_04814 [Pseudoalteromonas luteoviolacea 2ta16]KZN40602.1 hypothetical protein N483_17270 [Pseudoalteromonas luteoviolacea NCIMB 1944]MBQ4839724.1 hypothetical protein [Pseudoalteromonas luteoviolacea]MCG7551240.1 hypothetical protein [Pseudoalteromonas sp. Of7M-16]MDK2598196.1 hypothetical protein [Pseudoalteromonas sp. P94(2023)]